MPAAVADRQEFAAAVIVVGQGQTPAAVAAAAAAAAVAVGVGTGCRAQRQQVVQWVTLLELAAEGSRATVAFAAVEAG
jgi:hypothetical protein